MTNKKDMQYILALYGILLGSIVGATVWLFLVTINIGIHFIWGYLPEVLSYPSYYTLCVTIIGGGPRWSITKIFRYISTPYA